MKNTIKINGTEFKIKQTLRSLFIFEQITKKPFHIETLLDNYIYFYSVLLACNPDMMIQWDEFIDALDSDTSIFVQMNEILSDSSKIDELLSDGSDEEVVEKKS